MGAFRDMLMPSARAMRVSAGSRPMASSALKTAEMSSASALTLADLPVLRKAQLMADLPASLAARGLTARPNDRKQAR